MKKVSQYLLLFVTVAFVSLVAGIFVGRNGDYRLSENREKNSPPSVSVPDEKPIYSEEIYIDGRMNINAAGKEDISLLPGIGDTLADRIIAYREENGYFKEIDELLLVKGLGAGKLARIRDYIAIGKPK